MTKRAYEKFPREVNDFYPTPKEAVAPLYPHLLQERTDRFAEPCDGDGSLAGHLEALGLTCAAWGDITTGLDARTWQREHYKAAKVVITNPPWEARLMMEIMRHQASFLPSWFLIYSDWLFTHQSRELMQYYCTDVVPIGRLKWIKDSKSVGFDNCCWVRMWSGKDDPTKPAALWPMTA